jgi:VanZ family protein
LLSDKLSHFIAFAALMAWFGGVFRLPVTPWVALGLLAFGVLIELLQGMLPYRTAEMRDVLADLLGIAVGWAAALAGLRHWTRWAEALLPGRAAP